MQNIIEVANITYAYPRTDIPALNNISFSVPQGQFVAIIGPTGAGKSTLCYCFNGAVPRLFGGEMSGSVVVAGKDTYENEIPVMAQHVGLVVQNARNQLFNVNVQCEIAFGCENLGFPRQKIIQNLHDALTFVGLQGYENRQPTALSGGQQQRVAIACVLAMEPDVLVLDEPTSELDPIGSEQVMETITRLNRSLGKTVILVSHDTEFIAQFADRVLVINDGSLVLDGSPREVFSKADLLSSCRIRPPQVCQLSYELRKKGFPITDIPITIDEAVTLYEGLQHG
ncbi:MAG: ATP-binding cassette domain-containing protein [Anaerolineales bacterium]|nr:ATP-binding cassette domain-containing protein [Anaerolineales bacterium]